MHHRKILNCLCVFFLLCTGNSPAQETVHARFGINLAAPKDWSREQPFLNVMKLSRTWISQDAETWDNHQPLDLDEHGYVTRLAPGQRAATVMLTQVGSSFPGGRYIFLYDGKGTFEWKDKGSRISSAPGREVVEVTPGEKGFVHLVITSADPADYPRNMRFVREEFEETFEKEPFDPLFIENWKDADTLRFMDWLLINNSRQEKWADRPVPEDRTFTEKGIALEYVIALANQLKANVWVCIPHLADDDYIRQCANMLKAGLDKKLTVYFEYSNEVWNGMFAQSRWANEQGLKQNLDTAGWKAGLLYYAIQCNRMFAILDEVYRDEPAGRYKKAVATQAGNIGVTRIVLPYENCGQNADVLAVAPYITFNVPMERSKWAANIPSAAEFEKWTMDQLFDFLNSEALPQCFRWMDEHQALAKSYDLELAGYEGGQHLSALGDVNRNKTIIDLLSEANRDPRMGELYTQYLNHWTEIGGGVFCLYNSMFAHSPSGFWGLLEYTRQDPDTAPKYQAVKNWAKKLPAGR